ncbi:MAG TPA: MgtC/SapB family protein [Abditibacteriaceae bacterium]|jgi:putative Mg2+ transporter-C (MgtC) family protein
MNVWQEALLHELSSQVPDVDQFVRVTLRLLMALGLSAIIGWEREETGKSAGLRTHMLVGLGTALFVVAVSEAGAKAEDISRVVQGVAAGIGFIGGGVILKLEQEKKVRGLTTAATVWLTAAVGVAAGVGRLGGAVVAIALSMWILTSVHRWEIKVKAKKRRGEVDDE